MSNRFEHNAELNPAQQPVKVRFTETRIALQACHPLSSRRPNRNPEGVEDNSPG
jgi:hypothetical protein